MHLGGSGVVEWDLPLVEMYVWLSGYRGEGDVRPLAVAYTVIDARGKVMGVRHHETGMAV